MTVVSPHEYVVDFGVETEGLNQPQLQLVKDDTFNLTGFLPGISITTTQMPFTMNNIPVSEEDPNQTAVAIQSYFQQMAAAYTQIEAPFDFPPDSRVIPGMEAPFNEAPYVYPVPSMIGVDTNHPSPARGFDPGVEVRAVSSTEFEVWFTGASGKKVMAPLVITAASNDNGDPLSLVTAKVNVLKQSSPEFRVNPAEPDNQFTLGPDVTDQDQAAVAIDASGDFVIAWRSAVPNIVTPGSVSDIFARRFTPVGITDSYAPGTFVPGQIATGVRALPVPAAVSVQRLTFDAIGPTPLVGSYKLRVGARTTADVVINTAYPAASALNIQNALLAIGHTGVTVTFVASVTPGRFRFDVRFAGEPGVEQPPIEYVASAVPLAAVVTRTDLSGDLYTFRANASTANPQLEPHVALDEQGGFMIVWATRGQDVSFFNNIQMQRYDRYGRTVGPETTVNVEKTAIEFSPYVAMGRDGNAVVTWSETQDPSYLINQAGISTVYVRAFDPNGAAYFTEFNVGGGGYSTVALDVQDNFIVSWQVVADQDNNGTTSVGIHGRQFQLINPATGTVNPQPVEIRAEFRANSGSTNTASNTLWPFDQVTGQVTSDLDGDLVFTYEGHGPDASDSVHVPATFFRQFFRDPKTGQAINQDLLPWFNPFPHNGTQGDTLDSYLPQSAVLARSFRPRRGTWTWQSTSSCSGP